MSSGVPRQSLGNLSPIVAGREQFKAMEKKCENIIHLLKHFFAWLKGMIKLIFRCKKIFSFGHFLIFVFKYLESKNVWSQKSFFMPVNNVKEYLISIHTLLYLHTFMPQPLSSNCSFPVTILKKIPKLDPGNPEDMLCTNLGVAT